MVVPGAGGGGHSSPMKRATVNFTRRMQGSGSGAYMYCSLNSLKGVI